MERVPMDAGKHRILLSTSRLLTPDSAWGQALETLQSEGHRVVMKTGLLSPGAPASWGPIRLVADNIRGFVTESP